MSASARCWRPDIAFLRRFASTLCLSIRDVIRRLRSRQRHNDESFYRRHALGRHTRFHMHRFALISGVLVLVLDLGVSAGAAGQYARGTAAASHALLAGHNAARAVVGLPPLRWSDALARYAGDWAAQLGREGCAMRHRLQGRYGENQAWSSGRSLSPGAVVGLWVAEGSDYNPRANRCRPSKRCGHYKQIVWRETAWLGCAVARCARSEVWVCNYDPPGNYVGERPY